MYKGEKRFWAGFGEKKMKNAERRWVKNGEETTPKLWDAPVVKIVDWWKWYSVVWQFHHAQ